MSSATPKDKQTGSMFTAFNTEVMTHIEKLYKEGTLTEGELGEVASRTLEQLIDEEPDRLAEELLKRSEVMLAERRELGAQFQIRNFNRWKNSFNLLESVWYAAEEAGREFNNEFRPEAAENKNFVFEVLTRMHGRALLVAKEIIHLLKGGFPDGALSRWRTLHEIFLVTAFIKEHGNNIAERYLASVEFSRVRAANQLNQYAERANLEPFSDAEVQGFEEIAQHFSDKYGKEMRNPYGWARPAFSQFSKNRKVTIMDLEEATGLDHWRPRYKWASQHTHAGNRDLGALLAQTESLEKEQIVVCESNSGFVDPLQMTAMHVSALTSFLLLSRPTLDTVIMAQAIIKLASDVAHIAIEEEERTLYGARAQERYDAKNSK